MKNERCILTQIRWPKRIIYLKAGRSLLGWLLAFMEQVFNEEGELLCLIHGAEVDVLTTMAVENHAFLDARDLNEIF
jgi:hypothetical protein